ncbi:MAG TPA: L,D-transpeptidase [Ktedonosporobacter sp.]|nr:L,D-transpeptidase [Ktedonosporobacter sp.]
MRRLQKQQRQPISHPLTIQILACLAICLVLLSACSALTNNSPKVSTPAPTPIPTPTISTTLKNQGEMQLQAFQQWIALIKQYGGDTTSYQQQYDTDQQALQDATGVADYQKALTTLTSHVTAVEIPAMKIETGNLQQKLKQEVAVWGQQHTYHNAYDNTTYPLGFEYGPTGIGSWVQDELNAAKTTADYQQAVEDLNMYLAHFQAMTANSSDTTPSNKPHKTDLQLMQSYNVMNGKVLVVSLSEEAIRIYDNGQLVNSFLVTTGQPDLPTPPGKWWVESRQTKITFKSIFPKGSPYWYPDTPINYAMQYHTNGYFLHDSWWRNDYGPHTNFPHIDSSGNRSSTQGSHGCVNMTTPNAAWLYGFVQLYTTLIIY